MLSAKPGAEDRGCSEFCNSSFGAIRGLRSRAGGCRVTECAYVQVVHPEFHSTCSPWSE